MRPGILLGLLLITAVTASASPTEEAEGIPHVDQKAKASYLDYRYAGGHKAYAIAPGGSWSWISGAASAEVASNGALAACAKRTRQRCILYALNDRVVFDRNEWVNSWGEGLSESIAPSIEHGTLVGERFPNLAWHDRSGRAGSIEKLQGRFVFVHFWGSWCPVCMRELPQIERFQQALQERLGDRVQIVLLQVREPFSEGLGWARENSLAALPLFDSGATSQEESSLLLEDGSRIEDRRLARVFPTSYLLDPRGVVLFRHNGAIENWNEYLPLLEHAAAHHADKQIARVLSR
ncbi:MAG: TlpA disulfide reductase family protein [Sedimenticola sp.]